MADKIVVLNAGSDRAGRLAARALQHAGEPVRRRLHRLAEDEPGRGRQPPAKRGAETIGVRPEHVDVSTTAGEWPGTVGVAEHLGSDTFLHVQADGIGTITVRAEGEAPLTPGTADLRDPARSESASLRQGRPAQRLTAAEAASSLRRGRRQIDERQTFRRDAWRVCRQDGRRARSIDARRPDAGHRAFRRRQLPPRAPGGLSRRPVQRRRATTTGRSSAPACRRADIDDAREARGAGLAHHRRRAGGGRDRGARHRRDDRLPPAGRRGRRSSPRSPIPRSASSR